MSLPDCVRSSGGAAVEYPRLAGFQTPLLCFPRHKSPPVLLPIKYHNRVMSQLLRKLKIYYQSVIETQAIGINSTWHFQMIGTIVDRNWSSDKTTGVGVSNEHPTIDLARNGDCVRLVSTVRDGRCGHGSFY